MMIQLWERSERDLQNWMQIHRPWIHGPSAQTCCGMWLEVNFSTDDFESRATYIRHRTFTAVSCGYGGYGYVNWTCPAQGDVV